MFARYLHVKDSSVHEEQQHKPEQDNRRSPVLQSALHHEPSFISGGHDHMDYSETLLISTEIQSCAAFRQVLCTCLCGRVQCRTAYSFTFFYFCYVFTPDKAALGYCPPRLWVQSSDEVKNFFSLFVFALIVLKHLPEGDSLNRWCPWGCSPEAVRWINVLQGEEMMILCRAFLSAAVQSADHSEISWFRRHSKEDIQEVPSLLGHLQQCSCVWSPVQDLKSEKPSALSSFIVMGWKLLLCLLKSTSALWFWRRWGCVSGRVQHIGGRRG